MTSNTNYKLVQSEILENQLPYSSEIKQPFFTIGLFNFGYFFGVKFKRKKHRAFK